MIRPVVRVALVVVGLALLVGATAPFTNLWPEPGWWAVPHQETPDTLASRARAYEYGPIVINGRIWDPSPPPYDPLGYWWAITIGGMTLGGFLVIAGAYPRAVFVDRTRPNLEAARERQRRRSGRRPVRVGLALAGVGVVTFGAASIRGGWPGAPMEWWIASALIALGLGMLGFGLRPPRAWDERRLRLAARDDGPGTARNDRRRL